MGSVVNGVGAVVYSNISEQSLKLKTGNYKTSEKTKNEGEEVIGSFLNWKENKMFRALLFVNCEVEVKEKVRKKPAAGKAKSPGM